MDWSQELLDSVVWIAEAFLLSVICLLIVGFILIKTTRWASQFWSLAQHYFDPRKNLLTIFTFTIILLLSLTGVRISVLFSNWYNTMYTALQKLDENSFWIQMVVFSVLAFIHIFRLLLTYYLQQRFEIKWRENLNEKMLNAWLDKKSYYLSFYLKNTIDNPDQRIQQDITSFVGVSLSLVLGLISSMVSAVAFTVILWGLSGDMNILGVTIPRGMVFLLFLYILISTVFAFKIGKPLIVLNFLEERLNANYRYSLIRIREYAESIAFYAGEKIENNKLKKKFENVIENVWAIVHRNLKFQGFNFFISQASVVFPFIIQAPRFFAEQITLGGMIQTSQAFGNLSGDLSFFRNAYDNFAGYQAVLDRLTGFHENIEEAHKLPIPNAIEQGDTVLFDTITITTPHDKILVRNLSFTVNTGDALLIQGPSGSGKTTILRTIAGLWPYCEGKVVCPSKGVLFLSQKPYLPEGRLIDTLFYPEAVPMNGVELAEEVLFKVALPHLVNRIDEVLNWSHTLSLGEQQRIAFARLLLNKPKVAFLDEATSAMDEGLEFTMYTLLRTSLPDLRLVSVGHRSTLLEHHTHLLTLKGSGNWAVDVLTTEPS